MSDIARELGISTVSVSKALTGHEGVSDELREQIKAKASEMGYVYAGAGSSRVAPQGLSGAGGGTGAASGGNVGVLVSERFFAENAYYTGLYQALVKEFTLHGYSCILEILTRASEKALELPAMLTGGKISGLVILGQLRSAYIERLAGSGIPYLFLDFSDEKYAADSVVADNMFGSYLLTRHLIEKGHTQIGFVGNIRATESILDRYLGYRKAQLEYGLEERPEWLVSDRSEEGEFIRMELGDVLPTAYVCNCDEAGYRLVQQLREEGRSVPEDISVAAFDDSFYAKLCNPMLTTFRVDLELMSDAAAVSLIRKLTDAHYKTGRKVVSGELLLRDSVAERGKRSKEAPRSGKGA